MRADELGRDGKKTYEGVLRQCIMKTSRLSTKKKKKKKEKKSAEPSSKGDRVEKEFQGVVIQCDQFWPQVKGLWKNDSQWRNSYAVQVKKKLCSRKGLDKD